MKKITKYTKVKKENLLPYPFIEIASSFSYKYNAGNYTSADFFQSAKKEVKEKDMEKESGALYQFCKKMVVRNLNDYIELQMTMAGEQKTKKVDPYVLKDGKVFPNPDFKEEPIYQALGNKDNHRKFLVNREKNTKESIIH